MNESHVFGLLRRGLGCTGLLAILLSLTAGAAVLPKSAAPIVRRGAAPVIEGETKAGPYLLVRLKAAGVDAKAGLRWKVTPSKYVSRATTPRGLLEFVAPPGEYEVELLVITSGADGVLDIGETVTVVTISGTPGPVPPGPKPPEPVPPDPGPSPAPIPLAGLRVLVVYESAEASKLAAGHQGVIYGKATRDYLNSKCVVGPDQKTKEWRIYDSNVVLDAEVAPWKAAMQRAKAHPSFRVPWLLVSNGKSGYEGPLPETPEKMIALVKRYE